MKFLKQMNEGLESRYVPTKKVNIVTNESLKEGLSKSKREEILNSLREASVNINDSWINFDAYGGEEDKELINELGKIAKLLNDFFMKFRNVRIEESHKKNSNNRIKEKLTQAQYNEGQIFVDDFGNEYKFITRQRWEDDERYYAFKPLSNEGIAKSKEFANDWKNNKGPYAWWNGDTLWLDSGNSLLTLKESLKKKSNSSTRRK